MIRKKFKELILVIRRNWGIFALCAVYYVLAQIFLGTGCYFASTVGIPCPGCGGTRAIIAFFHGDFLRSFELYPILIPSAIFALVYIFVWLRYEKLPKFAIKICVAFIFILVAFYAFRMITMFPYTEPMIFNKHSILGRIISLFIQK